MEVSSFGKGERTRVWFRDGQPFPRALVSRLLSVRGSLPRLIV